MAIITQAQEVINRGTSKFIKTFMPAFGVISFGLVLIASFKMYPLLGFGIAFLFWKMVKEDFYEHTIDLRLLGLLALLILLSVHNIPIFCVKAGLGYFIFKMLFYANVKIYDVEESIDKKAKTEEVSYGYLPALGISLYAYLWIIEIYNIHIPQPLVILPSVLGMFEHYIVDLITTDLPRLIVVTLSLILILSCFSYRVNLAERAGKNIVYGFGDGDPLVLAVFAGLLGIEQLTITFFISLFVSIIFNIYHRFIQTKRGDFFNEYKRFI